MKVTYDLVKRANTLKARGLDMHRASEVFAGLNFTLRDERISYSEPRFITIGVLDERMVVLVWTPRGEARRIISMRKANDREQAKYAQYLGRSG
ncbi:BrnT family toxin [Allopusillimonas ginsengisoli]|nr:BrnT family toxin [Allopusillimonas ginsengisoli]